MACEVLVVESAVCELISRSTCMLRAMLWPRLCLAARTGGDVMHQARDLVGDLLDLTQRRAGVLCQQRTADHIGCAALHRYYGAVGIGLDGAHQHLNLLGGIGGPLGQTLHLIGNDSKAAAGLAGHGRLDRRRSAPGYWSVRRCH